MMKQKQFEQCYGNTKQTWKLVNKLTGQVKNKDSQIKLEINGTIVCDSFLIANQFNSFFLDIVN